MIYLLRLSGYIIYVGYIISDRFSNSAEYFRYKFSAEFIDNRNEDSRLHTVSRRYSVMTSLQNNLDIIEYETKQYVSYSRFQAIGINKEQLFNFSDAVYNFTKEEIFTIQSIKNEGFYDELFELGFEDLFYSSIAKTHKNLHYTKFGGGALFRKEQPVKIIDLIV